MSVQLSLASPAQPPVTADHHCAGAYQTWFHLYRLIFGASEAAQDSEGSSAEAQQAQQVQQVALAVEQFLQTSTVGEYRQRLDMIWSFRSAASYYQAFLACA